MSHGLTVVDVESKSMHAACSELLTLGCNDQGGVGRYHRDGGDAAFLTCMAGAIVAEQPKALVLLTASATPCTSRKDTPGAFLVLGPPGVHAVLVLTMIMDTDVVTCMSMRVRVMHLHWPLHHL